MADSNYRDETKQQLADATEVFALFDRDCDGLVETTRLDVLCRALGGTPPSASDWPRMHELKRPEFTNVGADGVGSVTLDDFLFVLKFKAKDAMTPQAILEAFRVFDDEGAGYVSSDNLRKWMLQLGTLLSPDEVDEMIREADSEGQGFIEYVDFVEFLMGRQ
jgi:Ca2+-binding EF-hand superfamily protein|tara:strand:- start:178 stop:666 length:489 start_codon:yes stop_codon:yes gene_type:complete